MSHSKCECCDDVVENSMAELVDSYMRWRRDEFLAELTPFSDVPFDVALDRCAFGTMSEEEGIHPHQRHIGAEGCREFAAELKRHAEKIKQRPDFEKLLLLIESICKRKKLRELEDGGNRKRKNGFCVVGQYDVALRLGYNLNRKPNRVFVHKGSREGADALHLKAEKIVKGSRHRCLIRDQIPDELKQLSSHEIEDFLCHCRKCFPVDG